MTSIPEPAAPATTPADPSPRVADLAALEAAYAPHRDAVRALVAALYADPETAFAEHRARDRVADLLEGAGFAVERGLGELDTALRARLGDGELVAALCVEYDALPGIGHGCGHPLIAGSSLGAALALAAAITAGELDGLTLLVIGTPAEEHGGGKQLLLDQGVFRGVDLALMTHPTPETASYDPIGSTSQAVGRWRATYTGRGAHAAANPSEGINANDAAVVAQVAAGLLRQRMRDGQRLALVPQQDGVTNIIPETAVVDFECRARTLEEFEELRGRLEDCLRAGALATGCSLAIEASEPTYEPLLQDPVLGGLWNEAMRARDRPLAGSLGVMAASTDMGNVSRRVPSLHPFVGITGITDALHTREFAARSQGAEGLRLMEDAALAMAWVVLRATGDAGIRAALRAAAGTLPARP